MGEKPPRGRKTRGSVGYEFSKFGDENHTEELNLDIKVPVVAVRTAFHDRQLTNHRVRTRDARATAVPTLHRSAGTRRKMTRKRVRAALRLRLANLRLFDPYARRPVSSRSAKSRLLQTRTRTPHQITRAVAIASRRLQDGVCF